jgi:hypothetical protein
MNNSPRAVTATARPTLAICFLIHFLNPAGVPHTKLCTAFNGTIEWLLRGECADDRQSYYDGGGT